MFKLRELNTGPDDIIVLKAPEHDSFSRLVMDSRNILYPSQSLFFAIKGKLHDGHNFVAAAYQQGVRNFVVSDGTCIQHYHDVNAIITADVIRCIQQLAAAHRSKLTSLKAVGITGSNGKTVVKEWLSSLLSRVFSIAKTPGSYNSQIGVALSVCGIHHDHELAVLEAGISKPGEMQRLETMIQPDLGIFTNLGDAHDNGFESRTEKLSEKLRLFIHCKALVYCGDHPMIQDGIKQSGFSGEHCNWGFESGNAFHLTSLSDQSDQIAIQWRGNNYFFSLPSRNRVFFENAMHCICAAIYLGVPAALIEDSIASWQGLEMRLQLTAGRNDCLVVNDSYTNDLQALAAALDFMERHKGHRKSLVILSEMEHSNEDVAKESMDLIDAAMADEVWLVGKSWTNAGSDKKISVFSSTEELLLYLTNHEPSDTIVLIKGSRKFAFENIYAYLISQSHTVSLVIDMAAIEHNLSTYGALLQPGTSLMPIIKASAYGAGSEEIAKLLEYKGVEALGVAFADEGAQLRKAGISTPIVVLNADTESFQILYENRLDLEIYGIRQLKEFIAYRGGLLHGLGIHLKLDTGMSRLGFRSEDMSDLLAILSSHKLNIVSVFSHLSSSEDAADDDFSHLQAARYLEKYDLISQAIGYKPKKHLLNSAGIVRFPEYHFDLVRLGLGLYGIDASERMKDKLEKVHTLKARIIQIKNLKAGDFVGYNRKHAVTAPLRMGVLNIGYADGFMRRCGNSRYEVMVRGQLVPVVGNVCMDLSMVDLTLAPDVKEGDEVILFGKELPIEYMALVCETIPYEILCRIAPRIQRKYTR